MSAPYRINAFGQPIGKDLAHWSAPPFPPRRVLEGWGCRLEPLAASHAASLWQAFSADDGRMFTYLTSGPFNDAEHCLQWVAQCAAQTDPQYYAIVDAASGLALGVASYLRIMPQDGCLEVGWLHFSPALQQSRLATAAMVLLMQNAFALGYRRYEWKCDSLNVPSRRAAQRLGFSFEGIHRQVRVTQRRNRDTAWYSILDQEWPALRTVLHAWLADTNFDATGKQRQSLSALTLPLLAARDPVLEQTRIAFQ
ncbi:MAG: GNAT family protein [Formivibrio sp.]|nr:GNAT family protein [Formivibrio sp.]